MSEEAEKVQRKTLKDLQIAGELLIRTTLKDYKKVWLLVMKHKEMRAGSGLLNRTVYSIFGPISQLNKCDKLRHVAEKLCVV